MFKPANLFLRGIAIVYFIAFASLLPQIRGLIGANGILPAISYLHAIHGQLGVASYWTLPSLAWINSSDTGLLWMCWAGVALSAILFSGFVPLVALAGCWVLYLSITNVGQDFLGFQWDALLLEAGFAALLIAPRHLRLDDAKDPDPMARWVLRILIFRLMFESGLAKLLSGDPTWRNLTALRYHYETQPLPTPLAWYAHQLHIAFHRISAFGMFVVELIVPFLFLVPNRRLRIAGASLTILFQLSIAATGNYTFFNLLTIILCIPLFDIEPKVKPELTFVSVIATILIVIGLLQIVLPAPLTPVDRQVELWHIVNHYGLFSIMTTTRPEIIVEGSDDGRDWKAYEFRYKPGDVKQPPHWVAPHQPRLDWQMWFAALSDHQSTPWFSAFMVKLLNGSPDVLSLLKTNPFTEHPPRFVRASLYEYHFSTPVIRRETGAWWVRTERGLYFPVVSLQQ